MQKQARTCGSRWEKSRREGEGSRTYLSLLLSLLLLPPLLPPSLLPPPLLPPLLPPPRLPLPLVSLCWLLLLLPLLLSRSSTWSRIRVFTLEAPSNSFSVTSLTLAPYIWEVVGRRGMRAHNAWKLGGDHVHTACCSVVLQLLTVEVALRSKRLIGRGKKERQGSAFKTESKGLP